MPRGRSATSILSDSSDMDVDGIGRVKVRILGVILSFRFCKFGALLRKLLQAIKAALLYVLCGVPQLTRRWPNSRDNSASWRETDRLTASSHRNSYASSGMYSFV